MNKCDLKNMLLHNFVELHASQSPNDIALYYQDCVMTYKELNCKSNKLANYIVSLKKEPEQLVGICLERGFDLFITIVALFKSGCAYVPLDADMPINRLKKIIKESNIGLAITQSFFTEVFVGVELDLIKLDVDRDLFSHCPEYNLKNIIAFNSLAYVIYTSGSTGAPKGVCIEHRGLVNLATQLKKTLKIKTKDNILQFSTINFDISIAEFSAAFYSGCSLILLHTSKYQTSYEALLTAAKQHEINIAILPTAISRQLEPKLFPHLKTLMVGGETCTLDIIKKWSKYVHLINTYGPTENTALSTFFECNTDYPPSTIGAPYNGVELFVYDDNLKNVNHGEIGELYLSGINLARGYTDNDLTSSAFISHPVDSSKRIYKTGDYVRVIKKDIIDYIGRVDDQRKIKGYRVNLGEIDCFIRQVSWVFDCYLVTRTMYDASIIIAYIQPDEIVTKHEFEHTRKKFLEFYLKENLPHYMIPEKFFLVSSFPLNHSGKIDAKQLYDTYEAQETFQIEHDNSSNGFIANVSNLCKILSGGEQVPIESDLIEFGFDSIKLLQLVSGIKKLGFSIDISDVFKKRTIRELSKNMKLMKDKEVTVSYENEVDFPLMPIQNWLYLQNLKNINHWNQAVFVSIKDNDLKKNMLIEAFKHIVRQHDIFNYCFSETNKQMFQRYYKNKIHDVLSIIDGNNINNDINIILNNIHQSINIENGPLLRAVLLFNNNSSVHELYIITHHFVIDGISWRILLTDLADSYVRIKEGRALSSSQDSISYGAFSKQLSEWYRCHSLHEEVAYWNKTINSSKTNLFTKKSQKENLFGMSEKQKFTLNTEEYTVDLQKKLLQNNIQMKTILLSALCKALQKTFDQDDFYIMLTGHGRIPSFSGIDLTSTIGWFTSFYPVCIKTNKSLSNKERLILISKILDDVPSEGFNYNYISENEKNSFKKNRPEVLFNYAGMFCKTIDEKCSWEYCGQIKEGCYDDNNQRQYLLEVNIEMTDSKIYTYLDYSKSAFTENDIHLIGASFIRYVKEMLIDLLGLP